MICLCVYKYLINVAHSIACFLQDSVHLYNSLIQPNMVKHEKEIDDRLMELKVKAMDFVGFAWNKAVIYGQKGFTAVLNHVTSLQSRTDQVHLDNQGSS